MKKFVGLVLILFSLYSLHHYFDVRKIRKDSEGFALFAVSAVSAGWNTADLKKYADDTLKASTELETQFAGYRKLGKLKNSPECDMTGSTSYKYPGTNATYVGVTYECAAQYEKAPATIQLTFHRLLDNAPWKLYSFNVNSSYLTTPAK